MVELCNFLPIFINVLYVQSALKMVFVLLFKVTKSIISITALILPNMLLYLYYVHFCQLSIQSFIFFVISKD